MGEFTVTVPSEGLVFGVNGWLAGRNSVTEFSVIGSEFRVVYWKYWKCSTSGSSLNAKSSLKIISSFRLFATIIRGFYSIA
jgi:hypothetical protein